MRLWLAALLLSLTASSARAQDEGAEEAPPAEEAAPAEQAPPPEPAPAPELAPPSDETTVDGDEPPIAMPKEKPLIKVTVEGQEDGADADVSVDSAADGVKPKSAASKGASKPAKAAKKAAPAPAVKAKPPIPPAPPPPPVPAVPLTPLQPNNP